MSQTQQESDRQARLERRRQLDREKRARETPDEKNRRRSLRQERLGYELASSLASQPYFFRVCACACESGRGKGTSGRRAARAGQTCLAPARRRAWLG